MCEGYYEGSVNQQIKTSAFIEWFKEDPDSVPFRGLIAEILSAFSFSVTGMIDWSKFQGYFLYSNSLEGKHLLMSFRPFLEARV